MLKSVRHRLVKLMAPKVYKEHLLFQQQFFRPMFEAIKSRGHQNLVGAEIGVAEGRNSERILKHLNVEKLYLIDPYLPYIDHGVQTNPSFKYSIAKNRLENYENKIVFITKPSVDAVSMLPELDFVYIDGNHNYDFVKKDISAYYPLVKKNGFLGGHDFVGSHKGVVLAAMEFAQEMGLELHANSFDWWVIKPENGN